MTRTLKPYTFDDVRRFCLEQKDARKIDMNDVTDDAFIGDIVIQFARAFYKRKVSSVGITHVTLVGAKHEYVAGPVSSDVNVMINFIQTLIRKRVTTYAKVNQIINELY